MTTYKDELRLTAIANENLKMNPQILIDHATNIIKQDIKKYGDIDNSKKDN